MKYIKTTIAAAVIAGLTGCGGGGSSDNSDNDGNGGGNQTGGEIIISGTVTKGTLKQADVVAFKLVDSNWVVIPDVEIESETGMITDNKGFYSFDVINYSGPVKVELQTNENTKMVCDAVDGCGEVPFGSDIDLGVVAPDFTLSSVSSIDDSDEQITLNVSALTHIASELMAGDLGSLNPQSIQQQNSKIANAFGVEGDITTLTSTNFISDSGDASVDADIVKDAAKNSQAELKYALVNAGIANALFKNATTKTITQLLNEATQDIVAAGGSVAVNAIDNNDTFELTTNEVLESATKTSTDRLQPVVADDADATGSLSVIETEVTNDKVEKEQDAGEDGRFDPDSTNEPVAATPIEKSKAMVNDARLFTQLLGMQESATETAGFVPQVEAYETLLLSANEMIDTESKTFALLGDIETVLSLINAVDGDAIEDGSITSKTYNVSDFNSGLSGEIEFSAETMSFSIINVAPVTPVTGTTGGALRADASEFTAKANLVAKINGFEADDSGQAFSLALSGSVSSQNALIKVGSETQDSVIQVKTKKQVTLDDLANDVDLDYQVEEISVDLFVEIEQAETTTVTNPIAFSGKLKTTLVPQIQYKMKEGWDEQTFYYVSNEELVLPENITLTGEFSALGGQAISANLTVNSNNAREFESDGFEGFGEEVENIGTVTVGADQKSIEFSLPTGTDVISLSGTYEGDASNWLSQFVVTHADNSETLEYESFSEVLLDDNRTRYVYTYVEDEAGDDFVWAEQFVVEPVGDYFEVYVVRDIEVDGTDYLGEGGLLKDVNGNTLMLNGDYWLSSTFASFDDFVMYSNWTEELLSFGDPRDISNMADLVSRAQANHPEYFFFDLENIGKVQLKPIDYAPGLSANLNAYVLNGLVENEVNVSVNPELTQLNIEFLQAMESIQFNLDAESETEFTLSQTVNVNDYGEGYTAIMTIQVSSEVVNGISDAEQFNFMHSYQDDYDGNFKYSHAKRTTIIPLDTDGSADQLADEYQVIEELCYGNSSVVENLDNCDWEYAYSETGYTVNRPTVLSEYTEGVSDIIEALSKYHGYLNNPGNGLTAYVEELGVVASENFELETLRSQRALILDANLIYPYETTAFESESNFINLAATLSLNLTLDDYDVNVSLSGTRNGFESGVFNLGLNYELADDKGIRDLQIMLDASQLNEDEEPAGATLTNSAGVKLVLTTPTMAAKTQAATDNTDLSIGIITVDDVITGEVFYRPANGLYSVKYSDDSIESLN